MPTDTNVKQVIINKLTEAQYDAAVKDATELYLTPDLPASTTILGPVKVDGTTITATETGVISALSNIGMPNTGHTETMTVGNSGTYYQAPADGWFFFTGQGVSGSNTHIELRAVASGTATTTLYGVGAYSYTSSVMKVLLPVTKDQYVIMDHANGVTSRALTFIYAKGAN